MRLATVRKELKALEAIKIKVDAGALKLPKWRKDSLEHEIACLSFFIIHWKRKNLFLEVLYIQHDIAEWVNGCTKEKPSDFYKPDTKLRLVK